MITHRPMDWVEKTLADHADEQYGYDVHWQARWEVERSKWWYAWERFADSMRTLTESIENSSATQPETLDTRDRIREYGPNGGQGVRTVWEEPRQ